MEVGPSECAVTDSCGLSAAGGRLFDSSTSGPPSQPSVPVLPRLVQVLGPRPFHPQRLGQLPSRARPTSALDS